MDLNKIKEYAPSVVRIGMALVFLWFSMSQFLSPIDWTGFIPEFMTRLVDPTTLIYMNATFELIFGLMLLLGIFTRLSALLLGLHLAGISFSLGYNAIAIRDAGLTLATLAVAMHGSDRLCIMKNKF